MKPGRPRVPKRKKISGNAGVVHVTFSPEQKEKLDSMTKTDRRSQPEFIRLLVDDEWARRNEAVPLLPKAV
jgi:hypothetical protein